MYRNPQSEIGRNMSKYFSVCEPSSHQGSSDTCHVQVSGGTNSEGGADISLDKNLCSSECRLLKMYIDKRFSDLESMFEKFENSIKELEIRQNKKLDSIIDLLTKKNS